MEDRERWQRERLALAMAALWPTHVKCALPKSVWLPNADIRLSIDAVPPEFDRLLSNHFVNNQINSKLTKRMRITEQMRKLNRKIQFCIQKKDANEKKILPELV